MLARIAIVVGLAFAAATTAAAETRVALVIGNGDYAGLKPRLPNPSRDATEIGKALGRLGFDVEIVTDADKDHPALLLGPLAVDPAYQGSGIGSALMTASIERAAALGHGAILLVGDAPYYARFGFSAELMRKLTMPAPVLRKRFLGLELTPGALAGAAGKVTAAGLPANLPSLAPAALRRVA